MIRQNILSFRTRHGMIQEDLAQKIGVARQTVTKWESGDAIPDLNNASNLAEALGVSLDVLVNHDEEHAGYPMLPRGSICSASCVWASAGRSSFPNEHAMCSGYRPEANF